MSYKYPEPNESFCFLDRDPTRTDGDIKIPAWRDEAIEMIRAFSDELEKTQDEGGRSHNASSLDYRFYNYTLRKRAGE